MTNVERWNSRGQRGQRNARQARYRGAECVGSAWCWQRDRQAIGKSAQQRNQPAEIGTGHVLAQPEVPLMVAAVALGLAIQVRDGEYAPLALGLLTMAIVTLGAALLIPRVLFSRHRKLLWEEDFGPQFLARVLCGGLAIQFALLVHLQAVGPDIDRIARSYPGQFLDALAIHKGAVAAAQVLDPVALANPLHLGMRTRHAG